jgi:hypothetical protein
MAGNGTIQGRTIAVAIPGRFKATTMLDAANLIERVDATVPNPVLGDMAVTVSYAGLPRLRWSTCRGRSSC